MSQPIKHPQTEISTCDPVWNAVQRDAEAMRLAEPALSSLLHENVLGRPTFEAALAARIAAKLCVNEMKEASLRESFSRILDEAPEIGEKARADIVAVYERDPACTSYVQPLLFFKAFMALQASRIAHSLWTGGRKPFAQFLQMRIAEVFALDIHPGARIGKGIMIDHGTGVVIGETAVVGDNVSILHGVTLGGTGKENGDRHPKIGDGVLIGAGASILGNIRVGDCSRVGAGSVVLAPVPPCKTVAGVPARIVGDAGCAHPSRSMDHTLAFDSGAWFDSGGGI